MDEIDGTPLVPSTPILKSCGNCALEFDCNKPSSSSAVYLVKDLKGKVKKLSTFEALWFILRGRTPTPLPLNSVNTKTRNGISLCSPCGIRFAKLIHVYQDFMSLTADGSFVKSLAEAVSQHCRQRPEEKAVSIKGDLIHNETPSVPVPFSTSSISTGIASRVSFTKMVLPPSLRESGFVEAANTNFGLPRLNNEDSQPGSRRPEERAVRINLVNLVPNESQSVPAPFSSSSVSADTASRVKFTKVVLPPSPSLRECGFVEAAKTIGSPLLASEKVLQAGSRRPEEKAMRINLVHLIRKKSPSVPVPFSPNTISADTASRLAFTRVPLPSLRESGFVVEAVKTVGLPRPTPATATSKRSRKSPIRTKSEPLQGNKDTNGDGECGFISTDWDSGLQCDGELINTDRAPSAAPLVQSPAKRQRFTGNQEKKRSRKRKRYIANPLRRNAPAPSLLSEEDQKLLITTSYKCDECLDPPQAFETLQQWVLHHIETHQRDLGYGDADGIRNRPDLITSHGLKRPCPECGKKHVSNTNMLHHIKCIHLRQFTVSCDICGKKLLNQGSLQNHIGNYHSSNKEPNHFLCTLCGTSFKTKGGLDAHEKAHLGAVQKRFSCHLCPWKCLTSTNLKRHIASHSEERPFNCSNCPATFKCLAYLQRHVAHTHNPAGDGKLPHTCEFCGKEYRWNRKISLKEHLISVHHLSNEEAKVSAKMKPPLLRVLEDGIPAPQAKRKPKTCNLCDRTYVRREGLFTHLIREHEKTLEEAKEITGLETTRLGKILPKSYFENSRDISQE